MISLSCSLFPTYISGSNRIQIRNSAYRTFPHRFSSLSKPLVPLFGRRLSVTPAPLPLSSAGAAGRSGRGRRVCAMYSGAMPLAIWRSPVRSPSGSRPWIDVGVALSGETAGNGYPPHLPQQDGLANKLLPDLWSSCSLLPPSVLTEVAGMAVFGDGQRPRAVVPWWDLVLLRLGKSFSRPPHGDLLQRCLLLRGDVQKLAVFMEKTRLDWRRIFVVVDSDVGVLQVVLQLDMQRWLVNWRSRISTPWRSSPTQLQSKSPSQASIASMHAPGYGVCLFLLEYVLVASIIINSPPDGKRIMKQEMWYLFLLVNCMQFHQLFGLVTVVVTANSGDVVWEVLFLAFEASFLIYQMASMLVGEVEHIHQSLCCIWVRNGFKDVADEDVRAFPFELIRRWRVRASSLLILRFNGKDKLQLSSVKLMKFYSSVPFNFRCTSLADRWESRQDTIGEHIGLRPSKTKVVVARQSSRLIRHQAPSAVFLILLWSILLSYLFVCCKVLYWLTSLDEVPHLVLGS